MSEAAQQSQAKSIAIENVIEQAIKLPGVKVNRDLFLREAFQKQDVEIEEILELGPVEAGCSKETLARLANRQVLITTSKSTAASFLAGLPGGFAMAATVPLDTLQFFAMSMRLAQEASYLYGADDLWRDGEVDSDKVQNQLILYLGVMLGVAGASQGVRLLSAQIAKVALKRIPQKALTKTFWYPFVKKIATKIGIKMTKDVVAKGASKAIPILGGAIAGGITFASMKPMGNRLVKVLEEANFGYSEEKLMSDYHSVSEISESDDEIQDVEDVQVSVVEEVKPQADSEDIFQSIEKLARLFELGAITEKEYEAKKAELLERI